MIKVKATIFCGESPIHEQILEMYTEDYKEAFRWAVRHMNLTLLEKPELLWGHKREEVTIEIETKEVVQTSVPLEVLFNHEEEI